MSNCFALNVIFTEIRLQIVTDQVFDMMHSNSPLSCSLSSSHGLMVHSEMSVEYTKSLSDQQTVLLHDVSVWFC